MTDKEAGQTHEETDFRSRVLVLAAGLWIGWRTPPEAGTTRCTALTDREGNCRIPVAEEGYYLFRGRHPETENSDGDFEIFLRYPFNHTIGLYDTKTDTQYYSKEDT